MNDLLLDDYPLIILPSLAEEVGLNESIILQQLHYWLKKSANERDGFRWVYNTYDDWAAQFPFWSVSTIRRTITKLEKDDLIIVGNYNKLKIDNTKWYRINYPKLQGMSRPPVQNEQTDCSKWTDDLVKMNRPLPETTTETTSETTKKKNSPKQVYDESSIPFQLANRLFTKILENNPNHKKPNLQKWADDMRLMMERDGRTEEQIIYLIDWCQQDSFWKSNILSASKLREKFDQLTIQVKSRKGGEQAGQNARNFTQASRAGRFQYDAEPPPITWKQK